MKIVMSIKNIKDEFHKLSNSLQIETSKNILKESFKMKEELKAATPIKTGFARAQWNTKTIANGVEVSNTADYIQYLNQGSSTQAPAYFIEKIALKYGKPLGTIVEVKTG